MAHEASDDMTLHLKIYFFRDTQQTISINFEDKFSDFLFFILFLMGCRDIQIKSGKKISIYRNEIAEFSHFFFVSHFGATFRSYLFYRSYAIIDFNRKIYYFLLTSINQNKKKI